MSATSKVKTLAVLKFSLCGISKKALQEQLIDLEEDQMLHVANVAINVTEATERKPGDHGSYRKYKGLCVVENIITDEKFAGPAFYLPTVIDDMIENAIIKMMDFTSEWAGSVVSAKFEFHIRKNTQGTIAFEVTPVGDSEIVNIAEQLLLDLKNTVNPQLTEGSEE